MTRRDDHSVTIDLDALALLGGQAARLEVMLFPEPPVLGGEQLSVAESPLRAQVDVSRTSSGFAVRLRADATLAGTCARCLDPAEQAVSLDAREVDQPTTEDPEMRSPYVCEGILDVTAWVHDAHFLAMPEQLICRPDCLGLCEICGVSLNTVDASEHRHEPKLDPRFAKLRELTE